MKPIRLLWIALIFVLGWSAWWFWGAWSSQHALTNWMEERRADGWQAEWSDISVKGYPTRIDRQIDDLVLANTEQGWVLNLPFFQILGLNYEKDHVVLVWPDEMTLQTPYETVSITGQDLKGSVTLLPGESRELDTATMVFHDLALASDAGWTTSVDEARLATRPAAEQENTRDLALQVTGLKPRSPVIERLASIGLVPSEIEELKADLAVQFDGPWDKSAIETARPQPQSIEIRDLGATWGKLDLRMAGDVEVEADGALKGDVTVKATNWQQMLEVGRESGLVPDPIADTVESALTLISGLAGRSDTLDIPLTFKNGQTRLGPVPIGPAPSIQIP